MTQFVLGRRGLAETHTNTKSAEMRGGKDEMKQMDPLFPMLHINDTEKGGPRAPSGNKMALCEEINIPPQTSSSSSTSMRPLPSGNSSSLVPSGSQSHVGCPQKGGFSSFCSLPGSSKMAERHHSYSSSLMHFDTNLINPGIQMLKPGNYQTFSTRGPSKIIAECHLFCPFGSYNSVNSSGKTLDKEDDFRVPYFAQLDKTSHCGGIGHKLENKKLTSSSLTSSVKHQTISGIKEKDTRSTDLKSQEHLRDWTDDSHEVSQMSEENAETPPLLSTGKMILADAALPLTRNMTSESGTRALVPTYQARCNLANDISRLHDPCAQSHQGCRTSPEKKASVDGIYVNLERFSRKRSYSTMQGPLCSSPRPGENNGTPNILESVNECPRSTDSEVGDAERSIAISDTSVVESKSGFGISPDDVVGVIGLKLFWNVRRTIARQQRIFAEQIFELHRLIKVQRLIAESPEMLSEDKHDINKPSFKCSPVKKLPSQSIPEAPSPRLKPKVDSQKPNLGMESAVEDANVKLPPLKCDSEKEHITPKSTLKPHSGSSTSTSFVSDAKLGPWYFHAPPGSQWLVPVRSPSEGLIYKPYTGPCPPTAGCIAPLYGTCGTTSLTSMDGDSNFCFQSYNVQVIDASNSSIEQGSRFARARSSGHDTSNREVNYIVPYQSSYNVTTQKGRKASDLGKSLPASRGRDLHGSTTSSPPRRVQGDALSLFPTTPTVQTSNKPVPKNNTEQQRIQVIKVVPHNPKSACESAARIFRSIQEERKKHD